MAASSAALLAESAASLAFFSAFSASAMAV